MAFAVSTISPEQQLQYQQGRANARSNLLTSKAEAQYRQGLVTQDFSDRTTDYNTQQNRQREQLPQTFIQGGIFHSGIYRDALKNYAIDRLAGERGLQRNYQQQMADLIFGDYGAENEYAQTVSNLFGNQYAAQASIAAALKGIL